MSDRMRAETGRPGEGGSAPARAQRRLLLHLHIPKTAGVALNNVIYKVYGPSDWIESDDTRLVNGIYYVRAGIEHGYRPDEEVRTALAGRDVRAVVGHFSYGIHQLLRGPYDYVTMLRHPIDRVVSLYSHIKSWNNTDLHSIVVEGHMGLEDFVAELGYFEVDNGQTRRISGLDAPFGGCERSMLEVAVTNLEQIVVAGSTERYVESVLLMKHALGWPSVPELQRENVTPLRLRTDSLSNRARALILERNQLDLELYELAARRLQQQIDEAGPAYSADLAALTR